MARKVIGGTPQLVYVVPDNELRENGGQFFIQGNMAIPVYGFETVIRGAISNPVLPVYVVSQAQVDSGAYRVKGGSALPMISRDLIGSTHSVQGGRAIPVYVVGGSLDNGKTKNVLVRDTFTDANGTLLEDHIPDLDTVGNGWIANFGAWQINENEARPPGTNNNQTASIDAGVSNCSISVLTRNTSTSASAGQRVSGIAARVIDENNYWIIGINAAGNSFLIAENNGGSLTLRASATVPIDIGTQYLITAQLENSIITAQIDGANEITYNNAIFNQEITYHGIRGRAIGDTQDNFLVMEL